MCLSNSTKRILKLCGRAGIVVCTILMDGEFEKTFDNFLDKVIVNTTGANDYVREIEQCICTVKEGCHAVISTLPLKVIPKIIVTNVVYYVTMWLNTFLPNS